MSSGQMEHGGIKSGVEKEAKPMMETGTRPKVKKDIGIIGQ